MFTSAGLENIRGESETSENMVFLLLFMCVWGGGGLCVSVGGVGYRSPPPHPLQRQGKTVASTSVTGSSGWMCTCLGKWVK